MDGESPRGLELNEFFEPGRRSIWEAAVEAQGRAAAALADRSASGLSIDILYDSLAESWNTLDGLGVPKRPSAWDRRSLYASGRFAELRDIIESEKNRGAESILLYGPESGAALELGPADLASLSSLFIVEGARPILAKGRARGVLDPLSARARGHELELEASLWRELADAPACDLYQASSLVYQEAGAGPVLELALLCAALIETLRGLESAGSSLRDIPARLQLQLAVGGQVFVELAKLRAARALSTKILELAGLPTEPGLRLHAVTSAATLSARDAWSNLIRVTTQAFAAVTAGAEIITIRAFDEALDPASENGRRLAMNLHELLAHEVGLGRVADPAGGAYAIEALSAQLAEKAWAQMQAIERMGGLSKAWNQGWVQEEILRSADKRRRDHRERKRVIIGVSDYACLGQDEPVGALASPAKERSQRAGGLPLRRDSADWEALRDRADALKSKRGAAPRAAFVLVGGDSKARFGFSSRLFEAAGFEGLDAGEFMKADALVLCGADADYENLLSAQLSALRGAGFAGPIVLSGKPGAKEAEWRGLGMTHFVALKLDLCEVMESLLGTIERGSEA